MLIHLPRNCLVNFQDFAGSWQQETTDGESPSFGAVLPHAGGWR